MIEDDRAVSSFISAALQGSVEVVPAYTAAEGLALVGQGGFDAVLVDHGLPDLTGIEVIRLLRADPKTLTMPLVLFTGSDSPDIERDARRAGADDYLAKPVEPLLLEERVLGLLTAQSRRA